MTAAAAGRESTSCWTDAYCLRHCEGYRVYTRGGPVGYVDEVVLSPDGDVKALLVQGAVVPIELVDGIEPEAQSLTVRKVAW